MRSMTLSFVLTALLVSGVGASMGLTPEEHEFLDHIDSVETVFTMPADVSDIVWSRALHFIQTYSWQRPDVVAENMIMTEMPPAETDQCAYEVTRTRVGEEIEFSITCIAGTVRHQASAEQNARLLAHYMKTGELPVRPEALIAR